MLFQIEFSTRNKTTATQQLNKILASMSSARGSSGPGWAMISEADAAKAAKKKVKKV